MLQPTECRSLPIAVATTRAANAIPRTRTMPTAQRKLERIRTIAHHLETALEIADEGDEAIVGARISDVQAVVERRYAELRQQKRD